MSESARARERLDFEAATEGMEKAGWNKETNLSSRQRVFDLSATTGLQFTSSGMNVGGLSTGLCIAKNSGFEAYV